ncbi:H-NS family nucleoid-associated regulatory protein [Azonexus sp.]|uniref:H-NS family nucleoid-associated regulatory protein n=1 Tax=Azonexus sp. TaxID=1872668 RepID=UPI0027B8ED8A|nr:H-NS family nucleoid-associated regulatory protein [Azonexus sp.]
MSTEIKYCHPNMSDLQWSGKGRQPKWVEAYLANGGSLVSLEVAVQDRDELRHLEDSLGAAEMESPEIDLGIGEASKPRFGSTLYAQRIVAGQAEMPAVVDAELQRAIDIAAEQQILVRQDADGAANPVSPMLVTDPLEPGQQQLEVCLREFGFQALTADEFIQVGIDELNQATIRACRAGVAFWAAQEAVKNTESAERTPEFKDWIADAGLTKQRVYECIAIAKFYSRLPEENRAKALTIGKKNALLLASLPQEVIDQAAESGNDLIGKADMMTVAQLKEEIRLLQRREKNYEAELERASNQVKRLSEAKKRTTDFLLRTEELREECMALQFGAELHLNSLKKLFVETEVVSAEGAFQVETIWIVANTLAARALDLVGFIEDQFPNSLPERPMTKHMLNPDEAARWLCDYPLIENRFAAEQAMRQEKRDAAKSKGPGRPKGSANKADGA